MGLKIVTGRTGTPHVSSNQIQAFNRSLLGDLAILDLGQHFDAVVRDANTIRIYDGCIVVQGIYAVIPHDEYEDVLVEPVSVGNTRIDTIYLHYAKDMETDTETVELDIAQGEEAVNNPVKPDIDAGGDTWEGTTDIRIPLYDVTVTSFETTIVPYEYMNVYSPTISELQERIPETTVSGVKGDAESEYRSGNVNITPTNIGLGNVDNTADTDKPISTATQTALNLKADLAYVNAKIASAYHPGGSKTVAELVSALLIADNMGKVYNMSDSGVTTADFVEGAGAPINEGDNVGICNVGTEESPIYKFDLLSGFVDLSAYATTSAVNAGLAGKVDKVAGKGLSTEDYTSTDKTKLAGIEAQANKTVVDSSMSTTSTNPLQNKVITAELAGTTTATGNPLTIEAAEANLVECVAEVEPIQEGSGDPSPDNIRPIIGHTEVAITDNGKTYTIQLGDTIYGGELDVVKGELRVDKGYATVDEDSEILSDGSMFVATNTLIGAKTPISQSQLTGVLCNSLREVTQASTWGVQGTFSRSRQSITSIYFKITNDITTVEQVKTYLTSNPLQFVYELATPYTIQLTPQQIRLLKGTNNISCNTGDLSIKYYPNNVLGQLKGDIESEYDARLERLEQYTDVFGFIEDMDVLSPTERIKYIGKNENYEPLTVDLNTGSYTLGDWGNFPFLVDNKPYMVKPDGTPDYQLNEYDYTKKLDGTDSDVANEDYDGGAFSWGRKIYKKQWMVGNKRHVLFSFDKKDGFHADGFINKDGKELDGRWIPMFYGTVVNGKAKSIATGNCITGGNLTTDAQHNAIVAFDSDANFFGGAFVETLIDLLMMFAKNSDLQAAYGYGNSSGYVNDSSKNYGMLNNAVVGGGQFYGRSGGKTLNKALHSIVLATYNTYMRDPYEVIKNGEVVVSEDYTYDPTGATYTDTGITVPNQSANAWRYPKKYIAVPRYGSIPDISVGGASTSLGRSDGTYTLANQSGAVVVCLRFGNCDNGSFAGLSCRIWRDTVSNSWWNNGFALLLDGSAVA